MADKTFSQLLAELRAIDEPKPPLLVKSGVDLKKPKQIAGPALGLLLKSAINDAVATGRLSGTAAVAGLKALGLDDDGKAPVAGDAVSATLEGMSPDQQRAAIDHMVRLGKLTGSEAVARLRALGLEG